jgi:hypothetical protein
MAQVMNYFLVLYLFDQANKNAAEAERLAIKRERWWPKVWAWLKS